MSQSFPSLFINELLVFEDSPEKLLYQFKHRSKKQFTVRVKRNKRVKFIANSMFGTIHANSSIFYNEEICIYGTIKALNDSGVSLIRLKSRLNATIFFATFIPFVLLIVMFFIPEELPVWLFFIPPIAVVWFWGVVRAQQNALLLQVKKEFAFKNYIKVAERLNLPLL